MKYLKSIFLIVILINFSFSYGQTTVIGNTSLRITFVKGNNGNRDSVRLTSIISNGTELLDQGAGGRFFTVSLAHSGLSQHFGHGRTTYSNLSHWSTVNVIPRLNNTECFIELTRWNCRVSVNIIVEGGNSSWDITVDNINGGRTLLETRFPSIDILATGNDNFFVPNLDGRVMPNPRQNNFNYSLEYPRGFGSTMQYAAYYNNNYGIYLGTHDIDASIKTFSVHRNNSQGVRYEVIIPAPDMGRPGNSWNHSGRFHFNIFSGDWYNAARIYRAWVLNNANYRPRWNPRKVALGNIAFWMATVSHTEPVTSIRDDAKNYNDYLGVPTGLHWYKWNNENPEYNHTPYCYTPRSGMWHAVRDMKNESITIMPYTNGWIFDSTIGHDTERDNCSVKQVNGASATWRGYTIMCPTQADFQTSVRNLNRSLIRTIGTNGIYIDQVCASMPHQCMDVNHNHPLGGGHFWRDGYVQMFQRFHEIDQGLFITSEGAADFLGDQVDGYLVGSWNNARFDNTHYQLVPAYQAVYSGRVQLLGSGRSTFGSSTFFCKHSRALVNGVAPGRVSVLFHTNQSTQERVRGIAFTKREARVRNELKDFLAFGEIRRPLELTGNLHFITNDWDIDDNTVTNITVPRVQNGVWRRANGDILVIFASASINNDEFIRFTFNGSDYGLNGNIQRQEFWTNSSTNEVNWGGTFNGGNIFNYFANNDYPVNALQIRGFIFGQNLQKTASEKTEKNFTYKLEQNYPNPFNPSTVINFSIANAGNTKIEVFNILGQKVITLLNKDLEAGSHKVKFNASNLSSGIYFYKLQSKDFTTSKKMILLK